eukprot:gnl/TRDRNA2_/TRDRNA2_157447_c0_seq3.p1 gnl/TRDRNA2_/TRDRNA2_157447_c0~~gnl/TRDRNA2_/TRDRNA2_157447_c0_seq3.p1  ORF type:complete len:143 (-),score=6.65 gnl/TRDRNA2_/TRDRNA2_157447_c0_seq3:75-503(-)
MAEVFSRRHSCCCVQPVLSIQHSHGRPGTVGEIQSEFQVPWLKFSQEGIVVAVYSPCCQFSIAMEGSFEKCSKAEGMDAFSFLKFRGDTRLEFVVSNFNVLQFPTVLFIKAGQILKYENPDMSVDALRRFIQTSDASIPISD